MARILVCALVLAAAAGATAVALAAQSPKSLRAAIFAAARKEHSVHYVEVGAAQGLRQTMVGDVAATRGIQQINFKLAGKKGRVTIIVVNRIAYLRGTAFALSGWLGYFTKAQAARFHGKWISVPPSNRKYKDLAASVTLPSFLRDIYPATHLSSVTITIGGQQRTGLRGTNRQLGFRTDVTLFPTASAPLLPEEVADVVPKLGFLDAVKISRWNERVRAQAPAHAVPISTVVGH